MPQRGLLVSIDGPGGVGKTTVTAHLASRLAAHGLTVHATVEPSDGPIGKLARALVDAADGADGYELACLYTADRYQHLRAEIRPRVAAGQVVVCDRYIASGLVVQRLDGIGLPYLAAINQHADRPDLAVILTAEPTVITERVARRGAHNRYQVGPGAAATELAYYAEAAAHLHARGVRLLQIDTTDTPAEQIADTLADTIEAATGAQGVAA